MSLRQDIFLSICDLQRKPRGCLIRHRSGQDAKKLCIRFATLIPTQGQSHLTYIYRFRISGFKAGTCIAERDTRLLMTIDGRTG